MAHTDDLTGNIDVKEPLIEKKSFKSRLMALSLSNVAMREWFQTRREAIKPWSEFLSTQKFSIPKSIAPVGKRVVKNIEKFQSNYMFIFIGLVIFCVLTSPLLLIGIAACLGACYIISLKNLEKKLTIAGREISLAQQYAAVGLISFPVFWIAGAGSAVFWVIADWLGILCAQGPKQTTSGGILSESVACSDGYQGDELSLKTK